MYKGVFFIELSEEDICNDNLLRKFIVLSCLKNIALSQLNKTRKVPQTRHFIRQI